MKVGELKDLIEDVPDDFELEIMLQCAALPILDTHVAKFGKAFTITVQEP